MDAFDRIPPLGLKGLKGVVLAETAWAFAYAGQPLGLRDPRQGKV